MKKIHLNENISEGEDATAYYLELFNKDLYRVEDFEGIKHKNVSEISNTLITCEGNKIAEAVIMASVKITKKD